MPKRQTVTKKEPTPLEKLLLNLSQEDMELVGMLKSVLIEAPRGKYNFNRGETPFQEHVLERAVRQLNMFHRGYFVEVGAADGETRSPTLCLELEDHWGGLLIEADPRLWLHLRDKRRKVSLGLACVGLTNFSYVGRLGLKDPTQSKLIEGWDKAFTELGEVNCYPLYTYLLAVYRTVIDFLVVNINGQELDVLKTLPWDKITIYIIAVCYGTKRERTELNDYLVDKGYHLHRRYHQEGESFLMFVRRQISQY